MSLRKKCREVRENQERSEVKEIREEGVSRRNCRAKHCKEVGH